jgi:hypothetical protein
MKTRHSFSFLPSVSGFSVSALLLCSMQQGAFAAPGDELKGEQQYNMSGIAEAEKSFWDPTFWRDVTPPLETPIVPGADNFLYFGRKGFDGTPFAEPARDLVLYTGAHSGFTPPAVAPTLARLLFLNDEIVFNGTPDVPMAPLGRLSIGHPHPIQLENTAAIEFHRTIVDTTNILLYGQSALTVSGDVTSAGQTYNLRNTNLTTSSRQGAGSKPKLLIRDGAIVQMTSFSHGFSLHPVLPNTGGASTLRLEGNASLNLLSLLLSNPAGVVVDAVNSNVAIAGVSSSGGVVGADPLLLFKAGGAQTASLPPSSLTVSGGSTLTAFQGKLAEATDAAQIILRGQMKFSGSGNLCQVSAASGGSVQLSNPATGDLFGPGSAVFHWEAQTAGSVITSPAADPLHAEAATHQFLAASGGQLDLPTRLSIDPTGQIQIIGQGANSTFRMVSNVMYDPFNSLANPAATWGALTMTLTEGASLRGGQLYDFGGGAFYPELRSLFFTKGSGASSFTATDASVQRVQLIWNQMPCTVSIGSTGHPSQLAHVDLTLGDQSQLTVRGGTWQPERLETINYGQTLQLADSAGNSHALFTEAAVIHQMDARIGNGVFTQPGDPIPSVANSTLIVNQGSILTGTLSGSLLPYGKSSTTFTGAGTRGGFKKVQLGVTATPMMQSGPPGPPMPSNSFFFSPGGQASLALSSGARVSVGSFTGAFSQWFTPSTFEPAIFAMNGEPVTIDATSAVTIGSYANEAAIDYRPGAMVVGNGGFLLGNINIAGAAAGGNDLVLAGGTISPGFSPGTMDVDGNFLMESGTLILEVRANGAGGWDVISADSITITGGTIIIRLTGDHTVTAPFSLDFFDTASLSIGAGVVVEIDPSLAASTFDPLTGIFSVVPSEENDEDGDGLDDRLEAVIPQAGTQLESLVWEQPIAASPVVSFRRLDASVGAYNVVLQWSTDLSTWHDIPIPVESSGPVQITANGTDPDLIKVTLPVTPGITKRFARLAVTAASPN